jgi:predicted signal transduction protein with EAL and GGDEF domain
MRIAASMGGVLWLGGGALAALMLTFSSPTRALGSLGWAVAGMLVAVTVLIGILRLRRPPPSDFGTLFVDSLIALGIALLEWLVGGRSSPYHQLYALPVLYAAAVHPRRRALLALGLICVAVWAPVIYAPPDQRLPADIAGQLLLLVVLAVVARIVFTLLRAQRSGLREACRRADDIARRDPLTGLGNRLPLEETLEVEVARARRQGTSLSLIVGDLDGFKAINDAYGHAGGDECLRRVARAIGEASRTEDQCYRWEGTSSRSSSRTRPMTTPPRCAGASVPRRARCA